MPAWTPFPYDSAPYRFGAAALAEHWPRLHAGDLEPLPEDERVAAAWGAFHAGDFADAVALGLAAAAAGAAGGTTAANAAQVVYASYLERREPVKLALLRDAGLRAATQTTEEPRNPNAYYWLAVALLRASRSLKVDRALAQGIAKRIRIALETAIALAPEHADAHVALGAFHAELIDRIGSLLGRSQQVSRDTGLTLLRGGLRLNPEAVAARIELASSLVLLEGAKRVAEADALYAEAAAAEPLDAVERLAVELAKAELAC